MLSLKDKTLALKDAEELFSFAKTAYFRRMLGRISQLRDGGYDVEVIVHRSDMDVDNFDAFAGSADSYVFVVIDGDLTVRETYVDHEHEPETLVLVTGNLIAENAVMSGSLEVHGDLRVKSCLVGDGNDCNAKIFGNLKAHFLYTGQHHFQVYGKAKVAHAYEPRLVSSNTVEEMTEDDVRSLISPDFFNKDGDFSIDYVDEQIVERMRSGESVLRSD